MDIIESKPTKENYLKFIKIEDKFSENKDNLKYFDLLLSDLKDERSYVRVRSFRLLTKLYNYNIFNKNINKIFDVFNDPIAINIRQYIQATKILLLYRPDLEDYIINLLNKIDIYKYKESMQNLIKNDIESISQ